MITVMATLNGLRRRETSSYRWLQPMHLRCVAALVLTLTLAPQAFSQHVAESDRQGFQKVVFSKTNRSDIFRTVRITPVRNWVEGNSLFADIQIENRSLEPVTFPGPKHGHFWDARLFDTKGEPVSYCGGVSFIDETTWRWYLLRDSDLVVVPPRGTVVLPAVYLAPSGRISFRTTMWRRSK